MGRTVTKSIAIIGEGETEWFYFDSLRIACRYPCKVARDFPQHSDIKHILKLEVKASPLFFRIAERLGPYCFPIHIYYIRNP